MQNQLAKTSAQSIALERFVLVNKMERIIFRTVQEDFEPCLRLPG